MLVAASSAGQAASVNASFRKLVAEETLMKLKRDELVGLCRGRNLRVSGRKLESVRQLLL